MLIRDIVIHCSDTPNGREHNAEDIHRWHIERGFDGIGYHYVIKLDGTIENGRPEYWIGAHASGHNSGSIGVCLIGRDDYTDLQIHSLDGLVCKLQKKYKGVNVIGHNEISKKECPGFDVQRWLTHGFK